MMLTPNDTLNDGGIIHYTYGLNVNKHKGLTAVEHGGTTEGFNCRLITFPEHKFTVICIFNLQNTNPWKFVREVADMYLSGYYKSSITEEKPKERIEVTIDRKVYKDYVGAFEMPNGLVLKFDVIENNLNLVLPNEKFILYPESETDFFLKAFDAQITFNRDDSGQVTELVLHQGGSHPVGKRKIETQEVKLTAEQLEGFCGDYYSDEVQVTYSVYLKEGKLHMRLPRMFLETMAFNGVPTLGHIDGNKFLLNVRDIMIEFTNDDNNRINGFVIEDLGRVRNLSFIKK
jgi:hypothetical protein